MSDEEFSAEVRRTADKKPLPRHPMTEKPLPDLHVQVKFGSGVPNSIQGPALLAFEKNLRHLAREDGNHLWIEVFKEHKGDDSKLRSAMTPEQRAKL